MVCCENLKTAVPKAHCATSNLGTCVGRLLTQELACHGGELSSVNSIIVLEKERVVVKKIITSL